MGNVIRLEEQDSTRIILVSTVTERRHRGKQKLKWEDGVANDVKTIGRRGLRNAARNRAIRRKLSRKVMVHQSCSATDDDDDEK